MKNLVVTYENRRWVGNYPVDIQSMEQSILQIPALEADVAEEPICRAALAHLRYFETVNPQNEFLYK